MPRDDLSIDFVRRMPPVEVDPALILDEWINRVQNLPEEIRFIQDEICDKDRQYAECVRLIDDRDGRIQKWIKSNGSHEPNPREETLRAAIRESFAKAEKLADEKIALTQKLQYIMDKHLRHLDMQIKQLFDRQEPGFTDPDEVPSLLRPSAANPHSALPSARSAVPLSASTNPITTALHPIPNSASQSALRAANPSVRAAQQSQQIGASASAPATPAASIILSRKERENSAGPLGSAGGPKRGPRSNSGLGSLPATSSGLARHSSLGPGTPKAGGSNAAAGANGVPRAGSAGPRATSKAGGAGGAIRKAGTPGAGGGPGRKKGTPAASVGPGGGGGGAAGNAGTKSGLSRVKRAAKNSPSSTADSELSDAESASGDESDARTGGRGTPAQGGSRSTSGPAGGTSKQQQQDDGQHHDREASGGGARPPGENIRRVDRVRHQQQQQHHDDDEDAMDVDEDETGDDKKYCICQNVSFGDMVACDNESCPYEWFHWGCVGLKSEPDGKWYCPVCTEEREKRKGK